MRPRISYDTKQKLDQLVDDIRDEPGEITDTDDQIRYLIETIVESRYGIAAPEPSPPWERVEMTERRRKLKRRNTIDSPRQR